MQRSHHMRAGLPAALLVAALALAACSPGHAAPIGATSTGARFTLSTTLDGLSSVPHRIHWQAFPRPSAHVAEVDFLIDGKRYWVEHHSPYYFGDDGNYLVTTFLAPGLHAFTVRAVDASGHIATDTVNASVPVAPRPPAALAGTWKGFAKQLGSSGSCTSNSGRVIPCPPAGYWHLVISPIGWQVYDTSGSGALYDVAYLPHRLAAIETGMATGHPNTDGNAWCNFAGGDKPAGRPPIQVRWTVHGNLLSFTAVGSQRGSCGFTSFLRSRGGQSAVTWIKTGS